MASYLRIGSALFAAALSISSLTIPARADNGEAALTEASKMMDKGIPVKAIEYIDTALGSGKLPPEMAAKALLMRAQAQEKLNKQAFALADYNSALWMEGLSPTDKALAEKGRDRISGKLGVEPAKKASGRTGENGDERTQTSAEVQTTPSEQRTGGIGSVFSGLFGSSEAAREQQQAKPAAAETPPAVEKPAAATKPAGVKAASAKPASAKPATVKTVAAVKPELVQPTKVKAERPAQIAVAERVSPAPAGDGSGKFGIQFAALHAEDRAIIEVERIAKKFGSELAGRSPSVKILATNDGGTLYRIVAEPYPRGEATAICELLKTKNLSCMVVSR